MNREESSALMDAMLKDLEGLTRDRPMDEVEGEADRFMAGLYRIGLEWHNNPAFRTSPEYRDFLQKSSQLLCYALAPLEFFVYRLRYKLTGGLVPDWKSVSEARSSIEFLYELYRDTPFAEFLTNFELGELDPALRRQAVYEGYVPPEEIPPGLLPAHWWWQPTDEDLRDAQSSSGAEE